MSSLRFLSRIHTLAGLSLVLSGCGDPTSAASTPTPAPAIAPATPTPDGSSPKQKLPADIPEVLFLTTGAQGLITEFRLSRMNVHDGTTVDVVRHLLDGREQNGWFDDLTIDATHTRYLLRWMTSPGAKVPVLGGRGAELSTGAFFVGDVARGIVDAVPVHPRVHAGEVFEVPFGFGASGEVYTQLLEPDRSQVRGVDLSRTASDRMLLDDPKLRGIGLSPDGKQVSFHDGKSFYIANVPDEGRVRFSSAKKLFTLPDGWISRWTPTLTEREVIYITSDGPSAQLEMFDLATRQTSRIHDLTKDLPTTVPFLYNQARRTLFFGGSSSRPANVYSFSLTNRTKQRLDTRATHLLDVSPDGRWLLETREEEEGVDTKRFSFVDTTTGQVVGEVPYVAAGMTGLPWVQGAFFIGRDP